MGIGIEDVLKALSTVEEPDLKKDLVTLGMVRDIEVNGNHVAFTVVLTTPACPLKELIRRNCMLAVNDLLGEELEVEVRLTAEVTTTRLSGGPMLPEVKNIIAISSGKGGVGKSTITTNLAIALAKSGATVGVIDADISGPSIPLMFGIEHEKLGMTQIGEKNYIIPLEKYGVKVISIGVLIPPDSPVVWRGPMVSSALRQFLGDCMWGPLDYLLIDMPPGTGDIHLTLVQTVPVTGAVIVTTPQKVAVSDAQKGLSMFKQAQVNVPVLGVIENMAYFEPEELPNHRYYLFGKNGGRKLAEVNDVPFLGEIPIVQSIREEGDSGKPSALEGGIMADCFDEIAESLARQVAIRNAGLARTKKVDILV